MLYDQPTAAPVRKIKAVGITSLIGPVVAAAVAKYTGLSEACSTEAGIAAVVAGTALLQGAVNFVSGYMTRERG